MDTQEFRRTGHQIIDLLADYFDQVGDKPLFPDVSPAHLQHIFDEPPPQAGESMDEVMRELEEKLLPYCSHVNHPGYFGLITPTPTPAGILGDLIASALNQNIGAYAIGPSGVAMERQTVRWLCDLVGYGAGAGGNLTSGGMTANFIGLKLARDQISGDRAQHEGVRDRWAAYVSEERHVSIDKAADAIGIGREGLRTLPTDDRFQIRLDALETALEEDKRHGIKPMCIISMAGTTNTGSVDDIVALRRIADQESIWLHVDAAYGGGMLLSQTSPDLLKGLEQADSVTMDPHKWFYAPLDAGAVLVKNDERLTRSFGLQPAYLTEQKDTEGERYQYFVHSFEQSRRFRSLKIWMSFKRYGLKEIGRWIDANVKQAHHLYDMVSAHPDFEAVVEPVMSAICIRYTGRARDDAARTALHHDVVQQIEESGKFWISTTVLKGKTYFRINPVNFRTRLEHIDGLFDMLCTACENVN